MRTLLCHCGKEALFRVIDGPPGTSYGKCLCFEHGNPRPIGYKLSRIDIGLRLVNSSCMHKRLAL